MSQAIRVAVTGAAGQVAYAMLARLAAGEQVEVLPQTITLRRNDTLVIRNDDTQPVQIGPFPIAPGQRFVQQYVDAGTIDLVCSVHQGERLRIVVE